MDTTISATEANRSFARILRLVRQGQRIRITSHGEVVAVMVPPAGDGDAEQKRRDEALAELEHHWASIESVTVGPWSREELYDRD